MRALSCHYECMSQNPNRNNPHQFAKFYVIFTGVVAVLALTSPYIMGLLLRNSNGSETGIVAWILVIGLYMMAGLLGIASLIVIPLFLFRKYFTKKFNILAILALALGVLVLGQGVWSAVGFMQAVNDFKREDRKHWAKDSQAMADSYVGLREQAAFDQAKANGVAARVVERDGESLAVTTDHSPYRVNLYIRNGKVHKVMIEGEVYPYNMVSH